MIRFTPLERLTNKLLVITLAASYCFAPLTAWGESSAESAWLEQFVTVKSQSMTDAEMAFTINDLQQTQVSVSGETFDRYALDGALTTLREGWPELPVVVRFMLIPPQSGVELSLKNVRTERLSGVNPLPLQPRLDDGQDAALSGAGEFNAATFVRDPAYLSHDGFWPPETAQLGTPAVMRGYRIVPVIIHPLRFNAASGELEVLKSADIALNYNTELNRVNLVTNPHKPKPSRSVDRILENLVLNPPPARDDDPHNQGSIVYVTGNWNDVVAELTPLVEWRRRMGWSVQVLRVQQNNNAESIRSAIREAYEQWEIPPEYVVICGDTDGAFPMAFFDMRRGANFPYESDHQFGMLDGDDILPEAAVGRFIFNSTQMLRGIVNKTIAYESTPFIGDNNDQRNWQKRAVLVAADNQSGTSSIDVCRWTKDLVLRKGFTGVQEFYWSPQNPRPNAQQFIINNINAGASIFIYRGWTFMSGFRFDDVDGLRNGRMLPLAILATCNTGDYGEHISSPFYYSERFNYHPNGGGIGAIGAAGATHTAYNNLITASTIKGLFVDGLTTQGWAFFNGKVDLYRHYADRGDINHRENPGLQGWICETYIFNMMGDPAVDLFTDAPRLLTVRHPEGIRQGETRFDVQVLYAGEQQQPAAGVQVCLYKAEGFQSKLWTDAEGRASFALDPVMTLSGNIKLTVTGHNLNTYMRDFNIARAQQFIGVTHAAVDDDNDGDSRGDDDGTANPAERLELTVSVKNFGATRPDGEVGLRLTTQMPQLAVVRGEARLQAAPAPGDSQSVVFVVDVQGGFKALSQAVFNLEAAVADTAFQSSLYLPVSGYKFEFVRLAWDGDPIRPGQFARAAVVVRNTGDKRSSNLSAQLLPQSRTIEVAEGNGQFQPIGPDSTGGSAGTFRFSAHPYHIGGSPAALALILSNQAGFVDTVRFTITVDQPRPGQPFGPDKYGYVCFDDTDENWFVRPTYDWIEIDTSRGGRGVNTGLRDTQEEEDASMVMDLPFPFQYYGEVFRQVTINTNGWISLGSRREIITARNRRIPAGMVSSAMICPFWDDLLTIPGGGIYTYFDEENHLFIVQWSRMRKLGPRGNNEPLETFQVILYDSRFHPSFTGDGDIKFQYQKVADVESAFQEWDTPFATVGIGSPDQTTGLEYTYWNVRNPAAAPLDSARAILFTTMLDFSTAVVTGRVTDLATGDPLEGVVIAATYGFSAVTNDQGYYLMQDVLVDTNAVYSFTASKRFFNDSTRTDFELAADDTLVVDFALAHPEFNLDFEEVNVEIAPEHANDFWVPLRNTGNGTLEFGSRIVFADPDRDDLWDTFLEFDITNSIVAVNGNDTARVGNTFINGVCFVDSLFYVTGGGRTNADLPAKWYRFDRNGAFVDSVAQPWIDNRGLRGVSFTGQEVVGGYNHQLYFFNPSDLALLDSIEVPPTIPNDVAYDRANELFYTCGITTDVFVVDREGNVVNTFRPEYQGNRLRKYGLAWYPSQPDSLKLFIFADVDGRNILYGMNPQTGETRQMADLTDDPNDRPLGIDVSDRWNSSVWTLVLTVTNSDGDRLIVKELEPNTSWLSYEPVSGTLTAGQDTMFHIRVEAGLRPLDRYWLVLRYTHNADPGEKVIPIQMRISEAAGKSPHGRLSPLEFSLEPNFPNPFNPATTIGFTLDAAAPVTLKVYDVNGRLIQTFNAGIFSAGRHNIQFDGAGLTSGVYVYRLEAGSRSLSRKMVMMK